MKIINSLFALGLGFFSFQSEALADALDNRKEADAAAHRGVIVPSAETLGKGDITFTSFELFFFNLSYGLSENTQASFSSVIPLIPGTPFGGVFSVKQKVMKTNRFQVSVMPHLTWAAGAEGAVIGLQVLADYALDPNGKYVISLSDNNIFALTGGDVITDGFFVNASVGLTARLRKKLALIVEANVPAVAGNTEEGAQFSASELFTANYGFRYLSKNLSGDFTFLRLLGDGGNLTPLGFPFVSFTAKF